MLTDKMKGPMKDMVIPDNVSLSQFILNKLSGFPRDQVLLIDGPSGRGLTCSSLIGLIRRTAAALSERFGLSKGTVVCLMLPNCPEFAVLLHGVLLTGATVTTCNPAFTKDELHSQFADSKVALVVTTKENVEKVESVKEGLPYLKNVIVLGERNLHDPHTSVYDLFRSHCNTRIPQTDINPHEDVALILYSSGTTGKPKGVMLTHYNCIANISSFIHPDVKMGSPKDAYLAVTPFFHVYGINVVLHVGLCLGTTIVTMPRFHPHRYLEYIQKYKVTFLHVVPPTALFLSTDPLVDKFDLSSVHTVFSGGAPLSPSVGAGVKKRLGIENLRQGYGMTEAGPGVLIGMPGEQDIGTVGVAMSNTEVKVTDPVSGITLPPNEPGEICARGPQIMKGYLGNQEATSRTIDRDGWLLTGDIGYYDKDGKFYIVDRIKELIKYKGFQVAPAELEALLLTHPGISDAAVIGKPDAYAGELPVAFVVAEDPKVSSQEILDYIAGRVVNYKRLRGGIIFVQSIPKSPSGKILRRFLRQRMENKL